MTYLEDDCWQWDVETWWRLLTMWWWYSRTTADNEMSKLEDDCCWQFDDVPRGRLLTIWWRYSRTFVDNVMVILKDDCWQYVDDSRGRFLAIWPYMALIFGYVTILWDNIYNGTILMKDSWQSGGNLGRFLTLSILFCFQTVFRVDVFCCYYFNKLKPTFFDKKEVTHQWPYSQRKLVFWILFWYIRITSIYDLNLKQTSSVFFNYDII